jgi:small subunit ribosomal protein S18
MKVMREKIGLTYLPDKVTDFNSFRSNQQENKIAKLPFDIFKAMKTSPSKEYKNTGLLHQFQHINGNIMPRYLTGLTKENQRQLAKSIKRCRHFGLLPFVGKRYIN